MGASRRHAWYRLRWSLYAPVYDLAGKMLDGGRRRSVELAAPRVGERVLIVGGGTGLDLPHLPPGVDVLLTDLAPAMLRRAEDRARDLGRRSSTTLRKMDGRHLDLPDDAFDVVLMHLILAVVPDPEEVMREAARVLAPGGRIAIFDKFLTGNGPPSLGRRLVEPVARLVATDINRRVEPMLHAAALRVEQEEPALLGGLFRVMRVRPDEQSARPRPLDSLSPRHR